MTGPTPELCEEPQNNTDFIFQHKVFALPSVVFKMSPDGSEAIMQIDMDQVQASLPLRSICGSFGVPAGSEDARLIDLLPRALKYRKQVRPGDSIPSEILDGKASWLVDPKYLEIANAKLTVQLVAWVQGKQVEALGTEQALDLAANEETKKRIQDAFGAIAEKLGIPRDRRSEVVDLVDRLANEMSYVEALRDRLLNRIRRMMGRLRQLKNLYKRERPILDEIERGLQLVTKPQQKIAQQLEEFDANMGEILPVLRDFQVRVQYIRKTRDKLREAVLLWEEVLDRWNDLETDEPSLELERAIRDTYRFAAHNFPQQSQWALSIR